MQKAKIICIILAVVLVSTGTVLLVSELSSNANVITPPPDDTESIMMDKPVDGVFNKNDALNNLYIAHGELMHSGGFRGKSYGTSVSMGISQEVSSVRTVVGDNVFKQSVSNGFVKMGSQVYLWGDNYIFRDVDKVRTVSDVTWKDTARKVTEETYKETYGYRFSALTGYILNDKTITEAYLESEQDGIYTYRYVLDPATAPYYVLYEMRTNAGTKGFATFSKAEIIVEMDENWQLKTLSTDCKYKVPMLGGVDCTENMREEFYDYGYNGDLPEKDFFEQYFDADISEPIDKEPDALSLLMEMFEPYLTGNKLNVDLNVASDGENLVNGKISANIDIENLDKITADVKVGDALYLNYANGTLYVTYGEFKGSTTIDGIMALVGGLMHETASLADLDTDKLLDGINYSADDNGCVVNVPLALSDKLAIDVNLYGKKEGESYSFANANVKIGGITVDLTPCDAFDVPAISGAYPEILGLLDIIQNGAVTLNAELGDVTASMAYDLASSKLYAEAGDLSAVMQDNVVYVTYGEVKVKLALDDVKIVMNLLGEILGDKLPSMETPSLTVDKVLNMLSRIEAKQTDNGVEFSLSAESVNAAVHLTDSDGKWNVGFVEVSAADITAKIYPSAENLTFPQVDASEYADVTEVLASYAAPIVSLLKAENYGADFKLDLAVSDNVYGVSGTVVYDVNGNVNARADIAVNGNALIKADVTVADGLIYLDVNGIKIAFVMPEGEMDVQQILGALYGKNDVIDGVIDQVSAVADKFANFDLSALNVTKIIKSFAFADDTLSVGVNAEDFGLGEFGLTLAAEGRKLALCVDGLTVGDVTLQAEVKAYGSKTPVTVPESGDYVLNLAGKFEGIEFAVSADTVAMDIAAEIMIQGETVSVRYVNETVYAKAGAIALKADTGEIASLIERIASLMPNAAALPDITGIDVNGILDSLKLSFDNGAHLSLNIGEIAVTVDFDAELNLDGVRVAIGDKTLSAETTSKQVNKLDVDGDYVSIADVADKVFEIVDAFKDAQTNGVRGVVTANVSFGEKVYVLDVSAEYNGGVRATLKLYDEKLLVAAEVYFVDNALYLDVNGVRVATELPSLNAKATAFGFDAVLNALGKAKGYNEVLDSIIDVIAGIPQKLDGGIDYLAIIDSFVFENGELKVTVNLEQLGLSSFTVSVGGTNGVYLDLANFAIGKLSINSANVGVTPQCDEISAPAAEDYVTEIEASVLGFDVTAKLDLYNKTVTAYATVLGERLNAFYQDGTVFVNYGNLNVKLNVEDIGRLLTVVGQFVDLPDTDALQSLEVRSILDGISKVNGEDGFDLSAVIGDVAVTVNFDNDARLNTAVVTFGDTEITAKLVGGKQYPVFDENAVYVDAIALAEKFVPEIKRLIDAEGYSVTADVQAKFGNTVFDIAADVNYNGGLSVTAEVSINNVESVNATVFLVNDVLYLNVNGLKFAMNVASGEEKSWQQTVNSLLGYNGEVDKLLRLVLDIAGNFSVKDVPSLIKSLAFDGNALSVGIDGQKFGLSSFGVAASCGASLNVALVGLSYNDISVKLSGSVKPSIEAVTAPTDDYSTNLKIVVDELNTVYADLDILNGVYRFRLDDLNVIYENNTFRINYADQILVKGNVAELEKIIERLNGLMYNKSQEGGINLGSFDIKAIAQSLALSVKEKSSVLTAEVMKMALTVKLYGGEQPSIEASLPVDLINKTLVITPDEQREYKEFTPEEDAYVTIEKIFEEYFPVLEKLVKTQSWHFDLTAQLDIRDKKKNQVTQYLIKDTSYVEFTFVDTDDLKDFKLRLQLDVAKKVKDKWQDSMSIEVVYFDGRVYVTYNGSLKLTLSLEAIRNCVTDDPNKGLLDALMDIVNSGADIGNGNSMVDRLVTAVPQIKTAILKMSEVKDVVDNAPSVKYCDILKNVSYVDGVFELAINAGKILSDFGKDALEIAFGKDGDSLVLNKLNLSYDNVTVTNVNVKVSAKDLNESSDFITGYAYYYETADGVFSNLDVSTENAASTAKNSAYHINLDSIRELLSAFINTADDRAFYVSGDVSVEFKFIFTVSLNIRLAVKVVIDENEDVYVTARLERENSLFYEDKGGIGYIIYDGSLDKEYGEGEEAPKPFKIVRNSYRDVQVPTGETETYYYCTKCGNERSSSYCWKCVSTKHTEKRTRDKTKTQTMLVENDYYANISTKEMTDNIINYIFELINLTDTIEGFILDSITGGDSPDIAIEKILKDYNYSQIGETDAIQSAERGLLTGDFKVTGTLSSISSALGSISLDIYHDSNFELKTLTGHMGLLGSIGKIDLALDLQPTSYGVARTCVKDTVYWDE